MAKKSVAKKAPPRAKVVRPARARPSAAAIEAAAKIVADAGQAQPTSLWEVLSPFKFRGSIVKPPAWIELDDGEAKLYQAAGVLGTEPGDVPDTDASESANGAADASAANGADSAKDGQGSNTGSTDA